MIGSGCLEGSVEDSESGLCLMGRKKASSVSRPRRVILCLMCTCCFDNNGRKCESVMILESNDNRMEVPWETPTFISFEPFLHFVECKKSEKMFKTPSLFVA